MTTGRDIAVRTEAPQSIADLEQSFAIAVRQRELLETYIKERLTPGKHFYQVAGSKNSLTKEGAELICLPHGYRPSYFKEGGPDQPPEDDTPYQITVRCQLRKGDQFAGEGIGSASSHVTRKDGQRIPRQPDPGLRHNATLKMAQKSAYIAATLNATAASEFFTQDMEDGAESLAAPHSDKPIPQEFVCPEHKTEWFKRGNMRGFAHPIGETGQWCNREDWLAKHPTEEPSASSGEKQSPMRPPLKTLGDLWNYSIALGYKGGKRDALKALGLSDDTLVGDLTEAAAKLEEAKK